MSQNKLSTLANNIFIIIAFSVIPNNEGLIFVWAPCGRRVARAHRFPELFNCIHCEDRTLKIDFLFDLSNVSPSSKSCFCFAIVNALYMQILHVSTETSQLIKILTDGCVKCYIFRFHKDDKNFNCYFYALMYL